MAEYFTGLRVEMKRSGPLKRKTPLKATTGLKRVPFVARRKPEAKELTAAREQAKARSGGRCEARISLDCTGVGSHFHHRQTRGSGGKDTLANGLMLCPHCHNWCHSHPAKSYELGLLVHSYDDPAEVRVTL